MCNPYTNWAWITSWGLCTGSPQLLLPCAEGFGPFNEIYRYGNNPFPRFNSLWFTVWITSSWGRVYYCYLFQVQWSLSNPDFVYTASLLKPVCLAAFRVWIGTLAFMPFTVFSSINLGLVPQVLRCYRMYIWKTLRSFTESLNEYIYSFYDTVICHCPLSRTSLGRVHVLLFSINDYLLSLPSLYHISEWLIWYS